ncbi:xylose isomerase-like protein [Lizonia empirigonia]|nr:xylose isomerase-like protein [Lizonia empirigonia]
MGGLDLASLATIPISYATCSLGSPNSPPPLLDRLNAISKADFSAVELSFPDILSYGQTLMGHEVQTKNYNELVKVAEAIKTQCDKRNLGIMMLQPFANFEGWIRIMKAAGTDMLQVGSTDLKLEKLDKSRIVPDLRELADKLKEHGFRVAYENWCWSTHAPDWKDVWKIVQEVDRPNIGLCLDTFQTAGGEWADPRTESGLLEDVSRDELEKRFKKSLEDEVFDGGKDGNAGEVDIVAYARAAKNVQTRLLAECAGEKIPDDMATR